MDSDPLLGASRRSQALRTLVNSDGWAIVVEWIQSENAKNQEEGFHASSIEKLLPKQGEVRGRESVIQFVKSGLNSSP